MSIETFLIRLAIAGPGFVLVAKLFRDYLARRRDRAIPGKPFVDRQLRNLAWSVGGFLASGSLIVVGHHYQWPMWLMWLFLGATLLCLVIALLTAFKVGYHSID